MSTLEAQPIGENCGEVSARQPLDRLKEEYHTTVEQYVFGDSVGSGSGICKW